MKKFEYQNPKYETMFKMQIFKCSKLFLSFVFWSFEFVSNFVLRISNFYLELLKRVQDNRKYVSPILLQSGQALVTLLFFMIVAITITSGAVVVLFTNSLATSKLEQGTDVYYVAESGAENALLRLLRDPKYCGETLPVDLGTATITVVDGGGGCNEVSPVTITSTATMGNFLRKIQVVATFTNNILTVSSWKEVF